MSREKGKNVGKTFLDKIKAEAALHEGQQLLTSAEYARQNGLHIETVRRRIRKGELAATLINRQFFIPVKDAS